jgi:tetratricopeptide (TPR) repeat protein
MSQIATNISILAAALLVFSFAMASGPPARTAAKLVCDAAADIALEAQDYRTAVELHRKFLRSGSGKNNALAHYHLGFAYGMTGNVSEEISEYRTAVGLGLNVWDLFLNLGLAYYDQHDLPAATAALGTAVLFGPEHAETHFNLAVVYERENRLPEALQEITKALVLEPKDMDAANTHAIIRARMGNLLDARDIWTQLVRTAPDYAPARSNLAILNRSCAGDCTSFSHLPPPTYLKQRSCLSLWANSSKRSSMAAKRAGRADALHR